MIPSCHPADLEWARPHLALCGNLGLWLESKMSQRASLGHLGSFSRAALELRRRWPARPNRDESSRTRRFQWTEQGRYLHCLPTSSSEAPEPRNPGLPKGACFTTVPGGGTACYVSPYSHRFLPDPVAREEGGTPGVIESIRAGLVFQLKEAVGAETIRELEDSFPQRAIASWSANPRIVILGNLRAPRIPIVSFVVQHGQALVHHNFVVALLNDLFGIQARGECSCAGPYAHRLFGIGPAQSQRLDEAVSQGMHGVKPGWVRLSFSYFLSECAFDFTVRAVHLVADHGWKLLPHYRFSRETGLWRHHA